MYKDEVHNDSPFEHHADYEIDLAGEAETEPSTHLENSQMIEQSQISPEQTKQSQIESE